MANKLSRLDFIVGLVDKASGPASKIMASIDKISDTYQQGAKKIAFGTAGLLGAGYALDRLIAPSREFQNAVREVRSLDVAVDVLDALQQKALKFSTTYGESAREFVASSYDIQSAIAGLTGNELPAFTNASAILAKGTKADTATITSFVGTMYGIFKNNADRMGKAQWVEQLAGQTATAVQMFKTTGTEMSAAFTSVGAEGQAMGASMGEQIAILGSLQATMSGAEAGTKYVSFLQGIGKAQDTLGLKFTDAQGKMKPTVEILRLIQDKYGDLSKVADSDLMKKAFGRKEATAFIKLMAADVDGLERAINKIGTVKGMDKAMQMAETMIDPWAKLLAGARALHIALGNKLMPVLSPLIEIMSAGTDRLLRWTELFPNLTRVVGIGVLSILGLTMAIAGLSILSGIWSFMAIGVGVLKTLGLWIMLTKTKVWAFNAALLANPITWVVLGIIALTGAVVAAVYWWDEIVSAFRNNTWMQVLMAPLYVLIETIDFMVRFFKEGEVSWGRFINMLSQTGVFQLLGRSIDWLMDKINLIPGINIDTASIGNGAGAPRLESAGAGGLTQHIIHSSSDQSRGNTIHIGKIETKQVDSDFINELEMAAG